jgi:hypothetical protein
MAEQVKLFEKNIIDYNNTGAVFTVVDTQSTNNGQEVVAFIASRKNSNAWVTAGSADSYNTAIEITLGGASRVQDILLLGHNFKNYTIEYDVNDVWTALVSETNNTDSSTSHNFAQIITTKIRLTITGTIVADDNKYLQQLIITRPFRSGQFVGWPTVKPTLDQNKKANEMLSGKVNLSQSLGGYTIDIGIRSSESANDLLIFQEMYTRFSEGFLIWPNGGDSNQFRENMIFWRPEDIFLVKPVDSYVPEWFRGIYSNGMPLKTRLKEVIR